MISLSLQGINLAIYAIEDSTNYDDDRRKIKGLKCTKIPIYKADEFLFFEVPKSALDLIFQTWDEDEIQIEPKAEYFIKNYRYNSVPLEDLKEEDYWCPEGVLPTDYQDFYISRDFNKTEVGLLLSTGAGKSLAMILRAKNIGFNKLLVVSTLNNYDDWANDVGWLLGESVAQYTGTKLQRDKLDMESPKIVFTNYEQVKEIKDRYRFDALILDEAQEFANPETKKFKEVVALRKKYKLKSIQASTATPIESRLDELWGIMHVLNPVIAGDKKAFLSKYQEPYKWITLTLKNGHVYDKPTAFRIKNLPELRKIISTILYRVDISENFKFEDKSEVIKVDMTPKQAKVYDTVTEEILLEVERGTFFLDNPMTKSLKLLQAAECTCHFNGEMESGKLLWIDQFIKEMREKEPETRIIFWCRFKELTNYLPTLYPEGVSFNGDMSKGLKKLAKLAFKGADNEREEKTFYELLLKHPEFPFKAPGTAKYLFGTTNSRQSAGMNLRVASVQVFISIDPSGRTTSQTMGRPKRLNTEHAVIRTIFLASNRTIDFRLYNLVFTKIKNSAKILDGEGSLTDIRATDIIDMVRKERAA